MKQTETVQVPMNTAIDIALGLIQIWKDDPKQKFAYYDFETWLRRCQKELEERDETR